MTKKELEELVDELRSEIFNLRWVYDKNCRSMFCRACGWNHNLHKHADDCYIAKLEGNDNG